MDGTGFHADLGAMLAASDGITQSMQDMDDCRIDSLAGDSEDYGHDGLAEALDDFGDRWQHGTRVLLVDGKNFAHSLDKAVLIYLSSDKGSADAIVKAGG